MPHICRRAARFLFGLALLVNIAGWLPPAQASWISTQAEIDMGRSAAKEIEKQYGLVQDQQLQERVARIGNRIAAVCDRPDLPYTFKVLNVKEINAFALPGGFIYICKGLIDYMPSDDELAGVIGHEVGHVVKRHTVHQIEKSMEYGLLLAVLTKGTGGGIPMQLLMGVIMAGFSREDERQADQLGFVHTMRAGYNPYSMLITLQRLGDLDVKANYDLFADHPEPDVRIKLMNGYLSDAKIPIQAVQQGKGAQVVGDGLNLPPLYATYKSYKPLYRAYFAAGALYLLTKLPDLSGDRFIVDSDGIFNTVLYDDRPVVVLTPQDASANNTTLDGLTEQYVNALKAWADKKSQAKP